MKAKVIVIDQSRAEKLMLENSSNRTLRETRVKSYANAMREGHWKENGESIIISSDGRLMDGQHRLAAIIEADAKLRFVLVEDVDIAEFHSIDQAPGRTLGDVLHILKTEDADQAATMIRMMWHYELTGRPIPQGNRIPTPTYGQMVKWAGEHPEMREALDFLKSINRKLSPLRPGETTTAYYILTHADEQQGERFMRQLVTGSGVDAESAVGRLRERLLTEKMRVGGRKNLSITERWALIFKAWNFERRGIRPSVLRLSLGGGRRGKAQGKEPFPTIL